MGFFIPILNLRIANLKKIVLGNVTFYDVNLNSIKLLRHKHKIRLGFQSSKKYYEELSVEHIAVIAVAKTEAGEKEMASNKAFEEVERSLNILRFFNFKDKFGTQRDLSISSGIEGIYWKNTTNNESGSSSRALSDYPYFPFVITKTDLNSMRKKGNLLCFSKLLTTKNPNKIQSKILTSLHWYGLSVKDDQDVDRFVKLVVSLESLVLDSGDEPKKHLLADRSAFILGRDKKARSEISSFILDAYSIRSDIVHEGLFEVSDEQTYKLLLLLRQLIFKLLKLSLSVISIMEISEKIRDIKFQCPMTI
jgi:hypothetical protein